MDGSRALRAPLHQVGFFQERAFQLRHVVGNHAARRGFGIDAFQRALQLLDEIRFGLEADIEVACQRRLP